MIPNLIWRLLGSTILTCFFCLLQGPGMAHTVKDLRLLDASFASQIVERQPTRISESCRLGSLEGSRLWFWVRLSCTGECEKKMTAKGQIKVFLDWYLREEGILMKQTSLPLTVKGTTWRTWEARRVKPGVWVA